MVTAAAHMATTSRVAATSHVATTKAAHATAAETIGASGPEASKAPHATARETSAVLRSGEATHLAAGSVPHSTAPHGIRLEGATCPSLDIQTVGATAHKALILAGLGPEP